MDIKDYLKEKTEELQEKVRQAQENAGSTCNSAKVALGQVIENPKAVVEDLQGKAKEKYARLAEECAAEEERKKAEEKKEKEYDTKAYEVKIYAIENIEEEYYVVQPYIYNVARHPWIDNPEELIHKAVFGLQKLAVIMGADCIIGLKISLSDCVYGEYGNGYSKCVAYGTAVKILEKSI